MKRERGKFENKIDRGSTCDHDLAAEDVPFQVIDLHATKHAPGRKMKG